MSVDLKALNIVSVSLFGLINCADEQRAGLTEKIRKYRKGWPRHPLKGVGLDVYDGFARHVDFSISRRRQHPETIQIRLEVHQLPTRIPTPRAEAKQRATMEELTDIMTYIENAGLDSRCHAHVSWDYEPNSHDTVIKLPMLLTSGHNMPFEFISGARFIQPSQSGDISIIIDTNREGRLVATAQIPLLRGISLKLIDEVVDIALDIIKDFVFEVSSESR